MRIASTPGHEPSMDQDQETISFIGPAFAIASALPLAQLASCSKTEKAVKLAIVGSNYGVEKLFNLHPNCVVNAICAEDLEELDLLKQYYPLIAAYSSFRELLSHERDLDAVALFTPLPGRAAQTLRCFERGWHVLSAVPACLSIEEAEQLKQAKEKTGCRYMMAETSYFRPGCIVARNLFKQGKLGEVFYTEAEYHHDRGDLDTLLTNKSSRFWNKDGTPSWRYGFPPLMAASHATAYLVGVTGERVTSVSALGWGNDHPFLKNNQYGNPFWNGTSLMTTSKGHALRCNVFWLGAGYSERAQWFGDKATLAMANTGYHDAIQQKRTHHAKPIVLPELWNTPMLPEPLRVPSPHGNSHPFIVDEFINAILQDREPAINLYDALAMTLPGIVAHQSALMNGARMTVPNYDPSNRKTT